MEGRKIIKIFQYTALAGVGFFVVIFCGASGVRADDITVLEFEENIFPADYMLTQDNSPYLLEGTYYVSSDRIFTINPGVVLKMGLESQIVIYGFLNINGTAENPVIITSYKDDEYAGDTNGDGDDTFSSPGNWSGLQINNGGRVLIDNVVIRYGGDNSDSGAVIELRAGSGMEIYNSVIEYSLNGIKMIGSLTSPSELYVMYSIIRNNAICGIEILGKSSILFGGNNLNNNACGMRVYSISDADYFLIGENSFFDNYEFGFEFLGDSTLSLLYNWWGSALGPTHPDNPNGDGNVIIGENVLFDPWVMSGTENSVNNAPVLSFTGDSGYESDGIEPNISFVNDDAPVFKVLFSDADADDAQYVHLIIGDDFYAMSTSSDSIFIYEPDENMFNKGTYTYHFEASDGTDSVRLPIEGELSFDVQFIPVILVPGIMGTELYVGEDKIWPDMMQMLSLSDGFMDVLSLDVNGVPVNSDVIINDIIRKPIITKDVFLGLINKFEDRGYNENTDLFVFPYDWRLDIQISSQLLKNKIDTILNETRSQNIDIIAHSMGGLLTKQYVLDNGSSAIDKLVFVGTPHLGAIKAAKALLFGDNMGVEFIFSILNPERIKYLGQNMLAVYQLLPSREYINQSSYYYYDHTQSDLFDFDRTEQFLKDSGLNPILLASADEFHNNLDNFDVSNINAYNINGCNTPTITTIIKRSSEEYSAFLFEGDGTVPLASSKAINTPTNKTYYFNGVQHSTMPSSDGIKELITSIVIGEEIDLPDNATQDSSQCVVAGKLVSVHSPVNLHIYDSEGNHVGRGESGDIEYNISGVSYEEIGENKFVFLPESGGVDYRIELNGTGSGTFSLRISTVENNEITQTAYYSDIQVNAESEATVMLSEDVSSMVLDVDETGIGNFETVSTTSVLNSEQSADVTKPITHTNITGGTNSAEFTLSASDENSGILKTEYSLDNGQTWNNYSDSVIINIIGETEVFYRSKDRAGNLEDYKLETIMVSSAAVILTPFLSVPVIVERNEEVSIQGGATSDGDKVKKKVLGAEVQRPRNEQYSDDDILSALKNADVDILLDYLGKKRDIDQEKFIRQKYGFDSEATNFICYGTKSTNVLGIGERAGVIYSFKEAFNRLPKTNDDWNDIIRISTNQIPIQRNASTEERVFLINPPLPYQGEGWGEGLEETDILSITYGLRPEKRDLELEIQGISKFVDIFGRLPENTMDWNILRSLVYFRAE